MRVNIRGMTPALTIAIIASIPAMATPVTGTISLASPLHTQAEARTGAIYWGANTSPLGYNVVDIGNATGDFAAATNAMLLNLVGPGGPSGPPVTGPVNVPGFAIFQTPTGTIHVDLNDIPAAPAMVPVCNGTTDTVGTLCTPVFTFSGVQYKSPFTLFQTGAHQTSITAEFDGIAYIPPPSSFSQLVDVTTSQTATASIDQIISAATAGQPIVVSTFSAELQATSIPEPGSILLMGLGLLGAGVIARKRIRN